jgi:hypothetical protein
MEKPRLASEYHDATARFSGAVGIVYFAQIQSETT